jgi:bifunctional non-homologous end joining protein LigD
MALEEYKKKRKLNKTPEPKPEVQKSKGDLIFVVQKHQARQLHYDFRLELNGVLKSWAIPKGPSLNPDKKHLAQMVEDHPFDYRDFEGIIPKGSYGAGTVMVWDKGTYCYAGAANRAESEKMMSEGLAKGHISVLLTGEKLCGEFTLVRLKRAGEASWLLIKAHDECAAKVDITNNDQSVKSGRTIDQIAENAPKEGEFWGSPQKNYLDLRMMGAKRGPMPNNIKPMMATLVKEPFDRKDWIFEIKWDGYRAITEIEDKNIKIYSRNNKDFNARFPEIYNAFLSYDQDAVFDGEIVAVDSRGKPSFQLLQDYLMNKKGNLIYYLFDILYFKGYDLVSLPLSKRREILKAVMPKVPNIKLSEDVEEKGMEFFAAAKKEDLEGIMAKNINSTYQAGKRGRDWLKIKNHLEQEFVIGGFTAPRGHREDFGSIAVGLYEKDKLIYIGNVGTGFDTQLLRDLWQKFQPLIIQKSVFINPPKLKDITWLEPKLVCEVKFQEWTSDGSIRQPVFLGLREDKKPEEVSKEVPK